MKFKFATLALATVLALSSTLAFARNQHYRLYDSRSFYRSYNSMNMMPGYWIGPGGGRSRSAISNGGPGGGGGASGGP